MPIVIPVVTASGAKSSVTLADAVVNTVTARNRPANPGLFVYGATTGGAAPASAWAKPGALIVAGRDNFGAAEFKTVAAGGGTVLIYLDPMIDNATGRYHQKLIQASEFGPAVPKWPGNPVANSYGSLNDFRVGSVLHTKLPGVIDLILTENPHISGIFLDDVGSRSWFPKINWGSWSTTDREAYRNGAIKICQTARAKADQSNLFLIVNGTWTSTGTTNAGDGGYPDRAAHGMALADGGYVENHPTSESGFWASYTAATAQWGGSTPRKLGFNWFGNHNDPTARDFWVANNYAAFASAGDDSSGFQVPWGAFTDFGLPRR